MIKTLCLMILLYGVIGFKLIENNEFNLNNIEVNYNQTKAKQYAFLSMITHCTNSQIINWNCNLCKNVTLTETVIVQNSSYHISGLIGYNKKQNQIVISWRGTVDAKNWEEDFKIQKTKYIPLSGSCNNCEVHAGVYQSYKSIEQQVLKNVNVLLTKYPTATITSTGHSLGGALSEMTALQISQKYPTKISTVYNYGCLRIGNHRFIEFLKSKVPLIFRVVHHKDPVPHLPPNEFDYIHPPYQVLYDEKMKNYKVCNDSGQDKTCSNSYSPYWDVNDHTFYWVKTDSSVC